MYLCLCIGYTTKVPYLCSEPRELSTNVNSYKLTHEIRKPIRITKKTKRNHWR